jgi:hypothetical protein
MQRLIDPPVLDPLCRWTILAAAPSKKYYKYWWCECSCGTVRSVSDVNLRRGRSLSCGCWRQEARRSKLVTHGMHKLPEYIVWCGMKQRCYGTYHDSYHRYGGRGIVVCDAWKDSFEAFYADMGPRPSPKHTLERHDNDGPYSKENCSWETHKVQHRNTRANNYITLHGRTECLTDWVEILGLNISTYYKRRYRGLSKEEALLMPVKHS